MTRISRRWSEHTFGLTISLAVTILSLAVPATAQDSLGVSNIRLIQLPETAASKANYVKPVWSPDGRVLAFETVANKQRRLFVYIPDSGESHEILSTKAGQSFSPEAMMAQSPYASLGSAPVANFDLTWSVGSDQRFAYVGSGTAGYYGIYSDVPAPNKGSRELLSGGTEGDPYVAYPDYHPETLYLVYCQGEDPRLADEPRLQLHGAAHGRRGSALAGASGALSKLPQLEPQFSPRGDAVVFTGIDRGNNDIYVWPLTVPYRGERVGRVSVSSPRRLTSWKTPEGRPSWSPDGSHIAFLSGREELPKEVGLWVMPADSSSGPRRLVERVSGEDRPEWLPDGRYILYVKVAERERNPIQCVNVQTGARRTLNTDAALHTHIDISPDGKRIAFCARGRRDDGNLTWLKLYVADLVVYP